MTRRVSGGEVSVVPLAGMNCSPDVTCVVLRIRPNASMEEKARVAG